MRNHRSSERIRDRVKRVTEPAGESRERVRARARCPETDPDVRLLG